MKVLVVDDETLIRNVIKEYLEHESYEVVEAENGLEAIQKVKQETFDLLIMDIMMPKMDGLEAIREIAKLAPIPTIMLSARKEEYDKLMGFELGIDDYITKPFSPKELLARIKAIMKRVHPILGDYYQYQTLRVDFQAHSASIDGQELKLTPKEYDLLVFFIENEHIALSREVLLSKLWGYDFFGDDRTIDTHIKMLRNNLGIYRDLISTVRGVGYKFELPEK